MLFEIGILILVYECILGWWSHFDLVCRIIVSRTNLLYYLRWESQICCMDTFLHADVSHTIFRSL